MRAFAFMLLPALLLVRCAPREAVYAEPMRCMENDGSDQRPGWDAGVQDTNIDASAVDRERGDDTYVRGPL